MRFDTTNPPGNERECINYLAGLLAEMGCPATLLGRSASRPNLVARLPGAGSAPPLLLYGHVDVVNTANQRWRHPPFEGRLVDGYVWGRGALDMKGGIVMMLNAIARAKAENVPLPGDVLLALVCDEENGGDAGARYLVENHADLFKGVRYALGEFGGFSYHIGKSRFYPDHGGGETDLPFAGKGKRTGRARRASTGRRGYWCPRPVSAQGGIAAAAGPRYVNSR